MADADTGAVAAHPGVSAAAVGTTNRWSSHRAQALGLRAVVYLGPIATSIAFVHYAGQVVPAPLSSLWVYLAWWFGLSVAATGVLVLIDRLLRRLLPLAALLQLSLVFPDEAPSRFRVAFRAGDVGRLEARLAAKEAAVAAATPSEAAGRLLELVAALNIHDPLTRGHCDRVRAYAVLIGEQMKLSGHELDLLNWAALLHDVGKLEVPTEVLAKSGTPTAEEWETLRKHTLFGEEIVRPLGAWLGVWTSAVGYHHERWDGEGYPRGLAGEDIPLPGRIVAVADVFDVITSTRSYKKASGAEDARMEIARCAGTQFDPEVVRAFLNVALGRMRFVMGPLSWLAHAPLLGRLPFTPALGTAAGVLTVAATSAAAGVVSPPPSEATVPVAAPPPAHTAPAPTPQPHTPLPGHHVVVQHPRAHHVPPPTTTPTAPAASAPPPLAPPTNTAPDVTTTPTPALPTPTPAPTSTGPTFSTASDPVILEDAAPQTDPWAQNIHATGAVHFVTSTDTPSLFTAAPSVAPDGTLTFADAKDAYGMANVAVTGVDDTGSSATRTLRITILPVNDAPTFMPGGDVSVNEGSGPQSISWATNVSPGPANESAQKMSFTMTSSAPSLFAPGGQPVVGADGTLSFTPAPGASGTSTVTATVRDDGGTADGGIDTGATATFHIAIVYVNQAPSFSNAGDVMSLEDDGPHAQQWATNISPGAGESGQTVTFSTSTTNAALFSAQPSISPTGVLTYTAAANANGTATVTVTAKDNGGTANGGIDMAAATFQITVTPVNDAPTFTAGANQSVLEDAGSQSVAWATAVSPGATNESVQVLTFTVTNTNNGLFSTQPAVSSSGQLTYTTWPDANGNATVSVTANDNGGTANGGVDTSATKTFTITVTPVNDAPTFTAGGNQTVLEDAGAQSLQWATAISPGPADESSQTVGFNLTNDNNALFSAQPSITTSGVLSYTPAANANGTATVTVNAQDNGGTAFGGQDTKTVTFTITVTAVNDAPTITPIAAQTTDEDNGSQVASVTTIAAGPANESSQTLNISASVDHPEYFDPAGQPTIDSSGTLAYTPATGAYGTASVTLTVTDNGGTANGGVDTTQTTFTITITPLPPIAGDDAYATTVGSLLTVDAAHGVLANDTSVNFPALTVTPQTTTSGLLGGTLTLAADGSFTYQANLLSLIAGVDQFTYTVTDGNGQTATATITITVSLAAPPNGTIYLQTSGLSSEVWALGASAPATVSPVPDLDGDNHPGLTIGGSDGKQTVNDPKNQQAWAYETGASTFSLHGPLTLHLNATSNNFQTNKAETLFLYVYDCPGGSSTLATTGCTLIAQNSVLFNRWNTTANYATNSIVASPDADLAPNRQLRIRVLVQGAQLWIPLVGPYESSVDYTG